MTGGRHRWYVPDGFLPGESSVVSPSHEAACLLNVNDRDAHVRLIFYFENREPLGPVEIVLAAGRTRHLRLDESTALDGLELPRDIPYAYSVESDIPIVVQHSRLDTSSGGYTLFTTIAYGE